MDTVPVGREFGSADYDRLMAEDAATFNTDMLAWIKDSNDSVNSDELTYATHKFPGDIHNIQEAVRKFGHDVSFETAASVWIQYSKTLYAGWISGADSIDSAAKILYLNCPRGIQHASGWKPCIGEFSERRSGMGRLRRPNSIEADIQQARAAVH
jgi:hypothetical protein